MRRRREPRAAPPGRRLRPGAGPSRRRVGAAALRLGVVGLLLTLLGVAQADACAEAPPSDWRAALAWLEPGLVALPELVGDPDARQVLRALGGAADAPAPVAAAARLYGAPVTPDAPSAWSGWIRRAAGAVTAYGLFVRDEASGRIVAAGTYWASPLLPRLYVVRLDAPRNAARPDAALLAAVGGCAVPVREWIVIPAGLLASTLREDADADVLLAAPSPQGGPPLRRWLRGVDLLEAVTFQHVATADLDAFSAWFAGEGPGPLALTRALPRLRSSLGPGDLWSLLRDVRR